MSKARPLFAFFGTSVDSRFALGQLERVGLHPALIVDRKTANFPPEFYNTQWDFFLVASYGKMLPKEILTLPRRGCINIHPSLLPKFRGPSPYVSAILADEREVGVSLMLMEEKMDAGPVIAQARIEIVPEDWPPKGLVLSQMLFVEGVNMLKEILPAWLAGDVVPEPQDATHATYTPKFEDDDALVDVAKPREAFLKIRAFDRDPRAHFFDGKRRIIITGASWRDGALVIETVLPEGKKEMPYADYVRGRQNKKD
ncbi:MAG: methionyl-tRNA formyltransferase [Patescibacteria group bacterium]|nr:methionyl-tRNA formyltransferase [Patescibacteria group bacterium]